MNIRQGVKNIEEKLAFKTLTEAEVRDVCLDEYMWINFKKRIILTHEISETISPFTSSFKSRVSSDKIFKKVNSKSKNRRSEELSP